MNLTQLINACGKSFKALIQTEQGFEASWNVPLERYKNATIWHFGKTPEEALINLLKEINDTNS